MWGHQSLWLVQVERCLNSMQCGILLVQETVGGSVRCRIETVRLTRHYGPRFKVKIHSTRELHQAVCGTCTATHLSCVSIPHLRCFTPLSPFTDDLVSATKVTRSFSYWRDVRTWSIVDVSDGWVSIMKLHNHILILLAPCHSPMTEVIFLVRSDFSLSEEGTAEAVRSS